MPILNRPARISLVGAAGYTGGELLRILLNHPQVTLSHVTSETFAGKSLGSAFAGLSRFKHLFEKFDREALLADSDLVFFAADHGVAMQEAAALLDRGIRVIDLSADFRLRNAAEYPVWYHAPHTSPSLLEQAVYGLPELNRKQVQSAKLVANPGCYPTATTLALKPLLAEKLIELDSIIIDAKSGVSGAGRSKHSLEYHFPELNENMRAYAVAGTHRHTPEIEQTLSAIAAAEIKVSFTPHLIPISRGIVATCYAKLKSFRNSAELLELYRARYRDEPFVQVTDLPLGSKAASGTNTCFVSIGSDARTGRITATGVIDNLGKGAAGQAVQNMNLMLGFDEQAGLTQGGIWP